MLDKGPGEKEQDQEQEYANDCIDDCIGWFHVGCGLWFRLQNWDDPEQDPEQDRDSAKSEQEPG